MRTTKYWENLDRSHIVLKEEIIGFVSNRLSFALLWEAIHLVNSGLVTIKGIDGVVEEVLAPDG